MVVASSQYSTAEFAWLNKGWAGTKPCVLLPALWHVRTRVISKSRGNRIKLDTRYSWTKDIHSTFILRFVVAFWNKYMCAMVLVKLCTWLFTSSSRGIWNQPQTFLFDWDITNNIIVMGTQWIYIYTCTHRVFTTMWFGSGNEVIPNKLAVFNGQNCD
jgi:hypothetical protein